jgi:very-short-patch-repair endonuclease
MPDTIVLSASVAKVVSFAMHQAAIPVVTDLRLRNEGDETVDNLAVELTSEPPVIAPRRWTFDRIRPQTEVVPADKLVTLDGGILYKLSERMRATVTIRVLQGETVLDSQTEEIIALARHEWGGSISTPELLAAFVTPNDPAVAEILTDASDKLRQHGRAPSLEGYQSGSRDRVWEIASAIWAAVAARRLVYAEPPASFESRGQKIRLPSEVLGQRLATCLDTAVLFAAALEQVGLRPLICLTKGHALTGVWLEPNALLGVTTEDSSDLRTFIALKEMLVFETTVVTSEPPATFSQALKLGAQQIRPELDEDFILALDIRQARARQVMPLPAEIERVASAGATTFMSPALDSPPVLGSFSTITDEQIPDTPQGRLDAWKRKLLDLTKRNRLLNLKGSKTAIRLVCADAAKLEDVLAAGGKITIVPLESLSSRGGGRDAETLLVQRKADFETELARKVLDDNMVPARLAEAELKAGIIELYRKAKSDLEEGGANTLFLAIGMLKWRESETSTSWYQAPLLLVPVRLERATAANAPKLMQHTDDTVFNMTLIEMLRQDFDLKLPRLEGELPTDGHGVDVALVLNLVRAAIRDVPGWEVLDDMVLSTFSFAKYLMWKDLSDNSEALRESPFVKHMIDTPRALYTRTPQFIPSHEQDDRIDPMDLLAPLSCDSSQVAAIHASGLEGDFVLEGPPGTGKSQTIANLIAHNLGLGRKVLFVAEKMTALNVVHDRLKKVGLGDFCLELHSSKSNKKEVLRQLDQAWSRRGEAPASSWEIEAAKLKQIRTGLNALVRALHTPGPTGLSPREAIVRASTSRFAPAVKFDWPMDLSADRASTAEGLDRMKELARELGQAYGEITTEDAESFASLHPTDWSFQWQAQFTAAASALVTVIDAAIASAEDFIRKSNLPGTADTLTDLQRLADFAASVPMAASMNLHAMLSPDGPEIAEKLRTASMALARYRGQVGTLSVRYDDEMISPQSVAQVKQLWVEANGKFWPFSFFGRKKALKEAMRLLGASAPMDLSSDLHGLESLAALRSDMAKTTQTLPSSALWRGLETDVAQVESLIRLGDAARTATSRLARDPSEIPELRQRIRTLFVEGRELLQPGMPVAVSGELLAATAQRLANAVSEFATLAGMPACAGMPLVSLRQLATAVTARANRLNYWCRWQHSRERAMQQSLGALVSALETGLVRPSEVVTAFDVSYARWIAPLLIDSRPELRRFSAVTHSQLVEDFRKLDANLAKLAAETVRARLSAVIPRKSDPDAIPGFGVLRREVQRKTGHSPVRKLVSDMGPALTRLTPCVLMSPHSVAQFLTAGETTFDLVVFDEASQIAVWDAIGAIARGKNAIIVGDPKQMPPTNFFSRGANTEEEEGDGDPTSTNVGDLESILDEGLAAGMHHHRLTGHYRSQHESLIAFSNNKYYGGELVTYPACVTQNSVVSLRRCHGAYQKGKGRTNPEEAKALVDEIVTRLTDPARRRQTIGVVTMNSEQQRLIRNLLDDARRRMPDIELAFKDAAGDEVEMVYNLETVQGHERDVIMLSIGYGPTVPGDRTMSMNFGPLNRAGGERRLNVAVTRAIREVVVFASFDPDMIDLTRTSAQAVHDLKGYLEFAQRGPIALARQSSFAGGVDDYESVFEEQVATLLRAKGWTIQTQVGVSKFRIDLGVVHPDHPGRFLAGVECDGATFHRSPTARDRDRVRHAILTSLGWKLVRLWSTDFFLDPDAATGRVHGALTTLLAEDRAAAADEPPVESGTPGVIAGVEDEELIDENSADFSDDDSGSAEQPDISPEGPFDNNGHPDTPGFTTVHTTIDQSPVSTPATPMLPVSSPPSRVPAGERSLEQYAPQFYEDAYLDRLRPVCLEVIDRLGPITFVHLAERVARAHGFQRTGSEIKKRVWAAVGGKRKSTRAPDGSNTFWPQHFEPMTHLPYRGDVVAGEPRPWSVVPYAERLGLAVEIAASTAPEARVTEMARRIGVGRLRAKTRDELIELLESAAGMLQSE